MSTYIQVWGERSFTRQRSKGVDLFEALSIVSYDSAHPIYLERICVHSDVAQN